MHVSLLLALGPPPFGTDEEIEEAFEALDHLASVLRGLPRLPLAVRFSGRLLTALSARDRDLIEPLRRPGVQWIRSGWGDPSFPSLPGAWRSLHLVREAELLSSLGVTPEGLWIGGDWDEALVDDAVDAAAGHILLAGARIPGGRVAVTEHLGAVLPVVPVDPLGDRPIELARRGSARSDTLTVLEVPDVHRLEAAVATLPATLRCALTTPVAFLASHPPGERVRLAPGDAWHRGMDESSGVELLYRKQLRLARQALPRPPAAALDDLLSAQSAALFDPSPAVAPMRLSAHHALIRARRTVDESHRRGDAWQKVWRHDWDADGREEVHVELPELSFVLDPEHGGALLYLDDKLAEWPVSVAPATSEEHPRWQLSRLSIGDLDMDLPALEVLAVEERRAGIRLDLAGELGSGGRLRCELEASGQALELRYSLMATPPSRFGPELSVALDSDTARARADGSEWQSMGEPLALSGHRFRLADEHHQLLIVMFTPGDLFLRPLAPFGVVVWPHWTVTGQGTYEMRIEPRP